MMMATVVSSSFAFVFFSDTCGKKFVRDNLNDTDDESHCQINFDQFLLSKRVTGSLSIQHFAHVSTLVSVYIYRQTE